MASHNEATPVTLREQYPLDGLIDPAFAEVMLVKEYDELYGTNQLFMMRATLEGMIGRIDDGEINSELDIEGEI